MCAVVDFGLYLPLLSVDVMDKDREVVTFSREQREAVVSLIVEMVNVDDVVAFGELVASNSLNGRFGVTDADFAAGRALGTCRACEVVAAMSSEQKVAVGRVLVEVIDADGRVDDREVELLERIGKETGLDLVFR